MEVGHSILTGLPREPADSVVATHLAVDERVLDERAHAVLTRVTDNTHISEPAEGALYLTDHRLLHLDGENVSVDLAEIEELEIAAERLLVTLAGLKGLIIEVEGAADFRTSIASAISALRGRTD